MQRLKHMKATLLAISIGLATVGTSQATLVVVLDGRDTAVTAQIEDPALSNGTFTFSIRDTSVLPGITGDITAIGFDLPNLNGIGSDGADRGTFTLFSETNNNFSLVTDDKLNATGLNIKHLDFALESGPNFNGGNPSKGIQPGGVATFEVSGDFSNLGDLQIAESIYVRFQDVNPGSSDVANYQGTPINGVPEPTTLLLVGGALIVLGCVRRRILKPLRPGAKI
jgi:hypothetical protein